MSMKGKPNGSASDRYNDRKKHAKSVRKQKLNNRTANTKIRRRAK